MKYHFVSLKNVFIVFCLLFILKYLYSQNSTATYVFDQSGLKVISYDSSLYTNFTQEYIIQETKKFADRQTEEDDPELIEFVKKIIKPPSTDKYNLRVSDKKEGDYSQEGQSLYIDELLNHRTNGFFVGMFKIDMLLYYSLKDNQITLFLRGWRIRR